MEDNQKQPSAVEQPEATKNNGGYFNLLVDDVPYRVEYESFYVNDQVRYYVTINAGPKDIFVWNNDLDRFRAIDDSASILPVALEQAISEQLQAHLRQ